MLAASRDGELVATTRADDTVRIWRIGSPRPIVSVQHPGPIAAVFGQAGRYVALILSEHWMAQGPAGDKPIVRVFQLPGGAEVGQGTLAGHTQSVELSADESLAAVVSDDRVLKVYELPSLRERWGLPDTALATFSPDGRFLGTVDAKDNTVRIWQAGAHTPVGPPAIHDESIQTLAFSRDGELFATGTDGGQVIVRHTRAGTQAARPVHVDGISDLAFAPDASVLASTSKDGSTRVMDCRTGVEMARLSESSPPLRVRFSPDGKYLSTETAEGIHVWLWRGLDLADEACRRVLHDLTAEEWRLFLGEETPTACRAQVRAGPR